MTNAEKATLFKIAELAEYQENAVVSSQVLRTDNGNITLFAFDKGQELSEHSTPHDALVQILDGKAEISIAKEKFTVEAGQAIILPADIPHAVNAIAPFKMLLTMLREA